MKFNHKVKPKIHNLSHLERQSIKHLKENQNIIIKIADKGVALTITDKVRYIKDGEEHLNDPNVYKKLENNPIPTLIGKINKYISELLKTNYIDQIVTEFLSPPDPTKIPFIHFLYKIHKVEKDKLLNSPIPIRPIVSGINGPFPNFLTSIIKKIYHLSPPI